jgi:dihydrolipoamide dehydrogenase
MIHACDIAIIGAGSAGLSALRAVRRQTDNFVIINHGPYGTTCARVGCMPSKALIEAANAFHLRERLHRFGVSGGERLTVDIAAVLRRVRRLRDDFVAGTLKFTDELGERSIAGRARLVEPDVLDVDGRRLRAKTIILATGSRPIVPAEWSSLGSRVLTSDTLFEQETLPPRMAVAGMGALGAELAQALARLGIEVRGFQAGEFAGGLSDPAVNETALALLRREFPLHTGARAQLEAAGEGVRVRAGDHQVVVDTVLAALGRRPNLDDLGLETLGVQLDGQGLPPFDPRTLQIAGLPVYLTGDANARRPLLHEAADDGHIAGYNATYPGPQRFCRRTPLAITFTDPNIAVVGRRHDSLDEQTITGEVNFEHQGRARMAGENHGRLRVYADRAGGRLLGAELCAPRGEHMAHLLALAVQQELTVHELLRLPFYHPVLEEGLRTALRDLSRQLDPVEGPDLAVCEPPVQ